MICKPFFNQSLLINGDLLGVVVTTISDFCRTSSAEEHTSKLTFRLLICSTNLLVLTESLDHIYAVLIFRLLNV